MDHLGDRSSSKWFSLFESLGGGNLRYKPMAATFFTSPKSNDRLAQLWDELLADPVPPHPTAQQRMEPVPFTETDKLEPVSRRWRVDLAQLFHNLMEPEVAESTLPSAEEAISEREAFSELSIEAAHEASLALSSPFRWEPKPAWIKAPVHSNPPFSNTTHPRRFALRPKIPLRPLHKRPFYMRLFFYLRRWLSGDLRVEQN